MVVEVRHVRGMCRCGGGRCLLLVRVPVVRVRHASHANGRAKSGMR